MCPSSHHILHLAHSEGFSLTGGKYAQITIHYKSKEVHKQWCLNFWENSNMPIFLPIQPLSLSSHEKRAEKCSQNLRSWSDVSWGRAQTGVGFCAPCLAQLDFFIHGRQWGRGAGQVNKPRRAWQFDIMHSDSTMKNLPWKNRHDLACFEKHLATEDIGFHTVRHKMWSTAGRRSPIEPRVLLWQRAAPCLHVYKMHCLCKILPAVFRLPIIGWR